MAAMVCKLDDATTHSSHLGGGSGVACTLVLGTRSGRCVTAAWMAKSALAGPGAAGVSGPGGAVALRVWHMRNADAGVRFVPRLDGSLRNSHNVDRRRGHGGDLCDDPGRGGISVVRFAAPYPADALARGLGDAPFGRISESADHD